MPIPPPTDPPTHSLPGGMECPPNKFKINFKLFVQMQMPCPGSSLHALSVFWAKLYPNYAGEALFWLVATFKNFSSGDHIKLNDLEEVNTVPKGINFRNRTDLDRDLKINAEKNKVKATAARVDGTM